MPPSFPSSSNRSRRASRVPMRRRTPDDWRCQRCSKLLGRLKNGVLHLRFERSHEYIVSRPRLQQSQQVRRPSRFRRRHNSAGFSISERRTTP